MTHSKVSVLLTCFACACTGAIPERRGDGLDQPGAPLGEPRPGLPTSTPPVAGSGAPPPAVPPPVLPPSTPNGAGDPGPRVLRRLTHAQHANTVQAALGVEVAVEDLLGSDRSLDGF